MFLFKLHIAILQYGYNKTESQPKLQLRKFLALGHPGRLAIIEYLINSPSSICNDIRRNPSVQPTISRHLSELKNVGLIQGTIMETISAIV